MVKPPKIGNAELLRLFKNAQTSLIGVIERANPAGPFRAYRVEQVRAIDVVLKKLTIDVRDWTETEIPKVIQSGATDAQDRINSQAEEDFAFRFSGVPESAVSVLTEDAYMDFGKAIVGMRQDGMKALMNKRKLQEKIVEGVIQGSSVARTQNQLIDILKQDGITALRAKNGLGRRFNVENYTNMLVRTQMMTAYNLGARTQMLGAGRRFAIFPTIDPGNREKNDPCWAWEKKRYVDLLKDPVPPASTHPHCRHVIQPISFEQLKAERPDLYAIAVAYFDKVAGE